MAKPYTCCQHLANLKVNHNPQQATGQGQVIVCIGKGVKIGITVQQILGRYKLNNIGLASVSCLHNWAGEKGQQDWSVGCLDSGAGDTDTGVRPRHSDREV